ncbi:MAG: winged helix-turn-helix domain-containing protein [Prevotella sp.]|uniref:winged helix-turn-helix domain-containing protein n=1 Tax=Prevotella sp. TaxID=59823 RepID=UPI002A2A00A7|nr:winged helix-turn-helix domain-containing protein [Prevotella sp.]MDD7319092.1 winged helix-turn-helix domain-containing protein [Prevotellaceae bacterium]MDY4019633.1 winged helix-turn-helix domain-containing protein [Prevotella sp.]
MKRWHSILIFAVLLMSSIAAGVGSYNDANRRAERDLNEALRLALAVQQSMVITPDTVVLFRSNIPLAELRQSSKIVVCSAGHDRMAYRAECSVAAVWSISDQRLSALLALASLLWGMGCALHFMLSGGRRLFGADAAYNNASQQPTFAEIMRSAGLVFNESNGIFYDAEGSEVAFTPMQHQLMVLFHGSDGGLLTKTDICNALWPKKENASETLYTLIKRLKPVVEKRSGMKIESMRGRAYRLTVRQ